MRWITLMTGPASTLVLPFVSFITTNKHSVIRECHTNIRVGNQQRISSFRNQHRHAGWYPHAAKPSFHNRNDENDDDDATAMTKQKKKIKKRRDQFERVLDQAESKDLYGIAPSNMALEYLATLVQKKKLNLMPEYQRSYVWDKGRASRLVVTVLCNRMVPAIVLHETRKGKFDVVDGKQRLTSLLSFYAYGMSDDRALYHTICAQAQKSPADMFHQLEKLDDETYEDLNGLQFADLSEDRQQAWETFAIPLTKIPLDTPDEHVFACYEDINSGGEKLSAQQIRRAVYFGPGVFLLDQLAANDDFQYLVNPVQKLKGSYQLDPQESDRELILRGWAWARNAKDYKRPMKTFLSRELQYYKNMAADDERLVQVEQEFVFVMRVWRSVFGGSGGNSSCSPHGAFRVWGPDKKRTTTSSTTPKSTKSLSNSQQPPKNWSWSNKISVGMWDVSYAALCELRYRYPSEVVFVRNKDALVACIRQLFESGQLDVSGPISIAKFMARKDTLKNAVVQVLEGNPGSKTLSKTTSSATRQFAQRHQLIRTLYQQQGGLCALCGNSIAVDELFDGTRVHVDHIQPFARGGPSTPTNAQLTHASCNQSKGARVAVQPNNDDDDDVTTQEYR